MQGFVSRDHKQRLAKQNRWSSVLTSYHFKVKMVTRLPASTIIFKKSIVCNGLAKLRGRFKRINLSNRAEASRINLFIFLSKPNLSGLLVFLN